MNPDALSSSPDVLLAGLIAAFVLTGKVPGEIFMALAVLVAAGFTCAEIGERLPVFPTHAPGCGMFWIIIICGVDSVISATRSRFRISNSSSLFVEPEMRGLLT